MKIREIEVDRFRIWRNLDLPVKEAGLNVVYGPNEAGKSTLMRLVRAILYGYDPEDQVIGSTSDEFAPWQGSLKIRSHDRNFRIRRTADGAGRGTVRISGKGLSAEEKNLQLNDFLYGVDERVFEDIFAIGLKEIQQLATMDSQQVSERIYGMSMGPTGSSLLRAIDDLRTKRLDILSEDGGRLRELFSRYQHVAAENRSSANMRERHAELTRERETLEQKLSQFKQRHVNATANLRGLEHISRCYSPWKRVRDLSKELESLPLVNEVSTDVFDRSDQLDVQIAQTEQSRDRYNAETAQLKKQLERMQVDPEIERNAATLRSFVDQADWLRDIDTQIQTIDSRLAGARHEVDHAINELGDSWSLSRLEDVDASPEANIRLLSAARDYQKALTRRSRLRRLNRKMSRGTQAELVELDHQLSFLNGRSFEEAIAAERQRIRELEDLSRLKMRDAELQLHGRTIQRIVSRVDVNQALPEWIDWVFGFFGVCGIILWLIGLYLWNGYGALAGSAFGFAGLMWWAFRSGLRNHFSQQTAIKLDDLYEEAEAADGELKTIRGQIQRLTGSSRTSQGSTDIRLAAINPQANDGLQQSTTSDEDVEQIRAAVQRIVDLEQLSAEQGRLHERRRKLGSLRDKFRIAQQQVAETRQVWCETLRSIGLDETVRIDEGFASWQRVLDANDVMRRWKSAAPEAESYRRTWKSMQERIGSVSQRMPKMKLKKAQPLEVLSAWGQQLKVLDRDQGERDRLKNELFDKERQVRELQMEVDELKSEKAAILARAGAVSRDELSQRQEWLELRRELEIELAEARNELESITAAEPNLAIVEDDLQRFDKALSDEEITLLRMEIEEVEEHLEPTIERLGSVKQEVAILEEGRETIKADFERGRLAGDIHRTAESLFALKFAERVVDQMRTRFESGSVSATLDIASEYLERLTQGRYHRIWTPLGEHHLCVDDSFDRTFGVEELSGGTREQLFVAIRMALVREFSNRGVELPMVMDDLFVNFDQERTEAAVDTLIEFANSGQQILFFTCHLHLARLFDERGTKTLWLPGQVDGDPPKKRRRTRTKRKSDRITASDREPKTKRSHRESTDRTKIDRDEDRLELEDRQVG